MREAYILNERYRYEVCVVDSGNHDCKMLSVIGEEEKLKKISKDIRRRSISVSLHRAVCDCTVYRGEVASVYLKPSYDVIFKKMPKSSFAQLALIKRDSYDDTTKKLTCAIMIENESELSTAIYNKIYKNTAVPIIEEWKEYITSELLRRENLKRISVIQSSDTHRYNFMAYSLEISQESLQEIIRDGITSRVISINNTTEASPLIEMTSGLDSYLNLFGDVLAERIQRSFTPKFDPDRDEFSKAVDNYDDSCFHSGVNIFKGQKVAMQAAVNNLKESKATFIVGEMGIGSCVIF